MLSSATYVARGKAISRACFRTRIYKTTVRNLQSVRRIWGRDESGENKKFEGETYKYMIRLDMVRKKSYCDTHMQVVNIQYIPRNMHTVFALLCFVVVIHWLIFPYPSGLLHWHCGNLTIAPVPAKQPWWIWINTSCEFIMNDCVTTTKQSTTKPCAYVLGYTVWASNYIQHKTMGVIIYPCLNLS